MASPQVGRHEHVTAEERQSLLVLAGSPLIWAGHFLACYVATAIYCAKAVDRSASLGPIRFTIGVLTVIALAGIAWFAWRGYRRHRLGVSAIPHDQDTPEDRTRFLGFATLLLSGLSAIAVIYAAAVALVFDRCR